MRTTASVPPTAAPTAAPVGIDEVDAELADCEVAAAVAAALDAETAAKDETEAADEEAAAAEDEDAAEAVAFRKAAV